MSKLSKQEALKKLIELENTLHRLVTEKKNDRERKYKRNDKQIKILELDLQIERLKDQSPKCKLSDRQLATEIAKLKRELGKG